jgi:hypothetical protein
MNPGGWLDSLSKVVWIIAGILVAVAAALYVRGIVRPPSVRFGTPFQAVLLANGSVYFGHLHRYGTSNPMLTDAYYIVSRQDPQTKQVTNTLVKRGKELHEPDRMFLSSNQIVFVETVGTKSKVAQLIAEQEAQR